METNFLEKNKRIDFSCSQALQREDGRRESGCTCYFNSQHGVSEHLLQMSEESLKGTKLFKRLFISS